MTLDNDQALQIEPRDLCGMVELTIEITCKRCKARTTLTFTPQEPVDICGFCEQPHIFYLSYGRMFGGHQII